MSNIPLPGFEAPTLSHLQHFLIRAGWARRRRSAGSYEIWSSYSGSHARDGILVPLDPEREDFQTLYERAEDELRRQLDPATYRLLEAQLALEVQHDLVSTSWKRGTSTAPGTIPWLDGQSVHSSITRQLAAAAKATVDPRARLGRSNSYIAQDFLSTSILAPSGVGSYVVTALTPRSQPIFTSPPAIASPGQRPRERQSVEAIAVVRTLDTALAAVTEALGQATPQEAIRAMTSSVKRGVSSELVAALAEFANGAESSVTLPRHAWDANEAAREYSFTPSDAPTLEAGARALAATAEPHSVTITGVVTLMRHEPESSERTVQVFTTSRGPVRRVRLQLSEEDYEAAVDAHKAGALVRATGRLTKPSKYWTISYPEPFAILDANDAEEHLADEEDLFNFDSSIESEPELNDMPAAKPNAGE